MKTNIFFIELSPKLEDGSRKTLKEHVIASCATPGEAHLIAYLLRQEVSYKKKLSITGDNNYKYLLTVETRKPDKAIAY